MSTFFYPTKTIKLSQLQSICKKYDELELIPLESNTDKERNYCIQSNFKKDIVSPYTVFGKRESNFLIVYCNEPNGSEDLDILYFRMSGSDPYHIVKIIQYETEVVINDEYTIDNFRRYEHFGIEDLSETKGRLWNEMSDEERKPFEINLTLDQSEDWLCQYGYRIEEEIMDVQNDKTLSEDERTKKLDKLGHRYHYSSKKEYLEQLETV